MRVLNELPKGWRMVQLEEIAEVVGGSTPSRANKDYWGGDIPWVVPSELTELSGRYLTSTKETITDAGLKAAGLTIIPTGSVLLTSRATIGITAINTMPVVTNQGFQNLIGKDGIDSRWLFYCISAMRHELERRASGSTFREVSRASVRSLPIPLPSLSEQLAIAAILGAIDDAIEHTNEVSNQLSSSKLSISDALLNGRLCTHSEDWEMESCTIRSQ